MLTIDEKMAKLDDFENTILHAKQWGIDKEVKELMKQWIGIL